MLTTGVTESVILLRKLSPIQTSNAPVFKWGPSEEFTWTDLDMSEAIALYQADRGIGKDTKLGNGLTLTTFYFEWERAEMGPLIEILRHAPESCNVAAGFRFVGASKERTYILRNGQKLSFDSTEFLGPDGTKVFVYKTGWLQGLGSLPLLRADDRVGRLRSSFVRHAGQARVLQGGVFNAQDESLAWNGFRNAVLENLEWNED